MKLDMNHKNNGNKLTASIIATMYEYSFVITARSLGMHYIRALYSCRFFKFPLIFWMFGEFLQPASSVSDARERPGVRKAKTKAATIHGHGEQLRGVIFLLKVIHESSIFCSCSGLGGEGVCILLRFSPPLLLVVI